MRGSLVGTAASSTAQALRALRPTRRGPVGGGRVLYLTFDDGPHPIWTPQVLKVLGDHDATATFFLVGERAQAQPALLARIRAEGHGVGNHGHTHARLPLLSPPACLAEIRAAEAALGGTAHVRPPFGDTDDSVRRLVEAENLQHALWDIDPRDWARPGVRAIVRRVARRARDGRVVLLHDGGGESRDQTVAALAVVLPLLSRRGFSFAALPGSRR